MKRVTALLLVLCLLLCGCNSKDEAGAPSTEPSTTPSTAPSTEPSTEATEPSTEPSTEPVTEPTQPIEPPPVLYRHPMNGAPLDAPWTGRPTAVVINNIQDALPQYGIGQADIVYEVETEGGITRCLALFGDLTDIGTIGPVRSVRTFFSNLAVSYDAPIIHCGGSPAALKGRYDDGTDTISRWNHINEQYNGAYFSRDYARYNDGYLWEHCLFTTGEKLQTGLAEKGYNITYPEGTDFGLLFDDDGTPDGETANTITVKFLGKKTTTMTYDAQAGVYKASQYGSQWMDAATEEQLSFENVIVLYTDQWKKYDNIYYRSYYDLTGSGEGMYACGGKLIPIQWSRDGLRSSFTYTLEDGTPLTLGAGSTYIAITADSVTSTYE